MPRNAVNAPSGAVQAIEFKGRMMLVSILRVNSAEAPALAEALAARMAEAPDLMRDMPLIVDFDALEALPAADLMVALERIRGHGFKVIGLQKGNAVLDMVAEASGLPILVLGGKGSTEAAPRPAQPPPQPAPEPEKPREAAPAVHTNTRIVEQPVRSGQQIYARGGDLIVLGAVSAGAEVLADGHIHIHGTLRGRALAGVRGLESARIFCRRLDAELVSIAGHYRIAEDILDRERGENRLVTLAGETIQITEI
jgi:septum site-determining protein MinC